MVDGTRSKFYFIKNIKKKKINKNDNFTFYYNMTTVCLYMIGELTKLLSHGTFRGTMYTIRYTSILL